MPPRFIVRPDSLGVAALLCLAVALGPLSTDLYLPSLPAIGKAFGRSVADTQLTLSVFLIGFAVSQLAYGPLSDRFGRRPVMLVGLAVFFAASIFCALAPSLELLLVGRFLQALGVCAGPVLARAVVRDVYGPERSAQVLAYMATAMALAPAVGPILGGVLETVFGWRASFWALVVFSVLLLAAVLVALPETNRRRDPTALRAGRLVGNFAALLGHQSYLGYALICAFGYAGIFAYISGSSFLLIETLGLSPLTYSLCFAAPVVGYMLGSFVSGRYGPRLGQPRLLLAGVLVTLVTSGTGLLIALGGPPSIAGIVAPVAGYFLGVGLMLPNAFGGALRYYPHMAGAASSLLGFIQMSSAALLGIGVGHLHDGSGVPMAGGIAFSAVVCLIAWAFLVRPGSARDRATRAAPTA